MSSDCRVSQSFVNSFSQLNANDERLAFLIGHGEIESFVKMNTENGVNGLICPSYRVWDLNAIRAFVCIVVYI